MDGSEISRTLLTHHCGNLRSVVTAFLGMPTENHTKDEVAEVDKGTAVDPIVSIWKVWYRAPAKQIVRAAAMHRKEAVGDHRGVSTEDEAPEPERPEEPAADEDGGTVIDGVSVNGDGEVTDDGDHDEEAEDDGKPLSDSLIRDLTAHRTLALRLALGEQPDMALIAVTHTLVAQTFYLASHADGIEDTAAAKALADRHTGWAADMPRDVADLLGLLRRRAGPCKRHGAVCTLRLADGQYCQAAMGSPQAARP